MSWIAVDLDGTLAHEDRKWKGIEHIGDPILPMLQRVKRWLKQGEEVKCWTARIANDPDAARFVRAWLDAHGLQAMGMTALKDPDMIEAWDDRTVCVQRNTGKILGRNRQRALPCRKP